ncbi:hypothetical protein MRX96_043334 [Rhipicephalus microplus]
MKPRNERYAIVDQTSTEDGLLLQLQLVDSWSKLGNESKRLTVDVMQFARDTARLRIFDPSKKEFEPPVPVITPEYESGTVSYTFSLLFEVHLQSAFYADKVKQLAISLCSGQYFYGLRGPRGALFVQAGRWSKHTIYRSENTADYTDKEDVGIFESLHPFIIIATKDSKVTLGLFFLTIHDIELTLSSKGIATFRTTGGLLDVFFFFGPDPTSVAKQYLRLVGFPSLPSLLLLRNGISRPVAYILDGGVYNSKTLDIQMNAEGPKPAQVYDLTHPRGAHSFHELLSDQELEYAVDYRGTIALRRPECVGDGNASAHMLSASTYAELRNAYETILAKATYRSISKNAAELPQLLLQNRFQGAGRWSGYWNSERNPYKRSVQDMLLHNMMGLPVYGTAPCRLRDVVDARAYRACSRLAHLTAYFPVHRHADCSVTVRPHEQPWNDSRKKYHLKLEEATCSAPMLRASLLPYTFTALYQSHKSGAMLARPMFFE